MDRRSFLTYAGVAGLAAAVGGRRPAAAIGAPPYPFTLGVASGEPQPDGFVIWTRLAPDPLAVDGGMRATPAPVQWEVAEDESFRRVVARGTFLATADDAHSVHIAVAGLRAGADHVYRFRAGAHLSPVGRARTLPAAGSSSPLRIVSAGDASYADSLFAGYAAIAAEPDVDLVLFLGDYIYEGDPALTGLPQVRAVPAPEAPPLDQLTTLNDYRRRYAATKTDPFLQAAHAAAVWVAVPDDHEVENDYAGFDDVADRGGPAFSDRAAFALQRANAYKAYWEHLPLHPSMRPVGPTMPLHRRFPLGALATLHVLDTRQFRQHPALFLPGNFGPEVLGRTNPGSMLGAEQEAWFASSIAGAAPSARWQLVGQGVPLMQARLVNPAGSSPPTLFAYDQWDGYGPARRRLLDAAVAAAPEHLVVLSADIHAAAAGDLRLDFDDPSTPPIGAELIAPALATTPMDAGNYAVLQVSNARFNPHVRYLERVNGYLRTTVTADRLTAEYRVVSDITRRDATVATGATMVIDHADGRLRRL